MRPVIPLCVFSCVLGPPLPESAAVAAAAVYRCVAGDLVIYADHPCEPAAEPYQPDDSRISTYSPPAPAPAAERTRDTSTRRSARGPAPSIAERQATHKARCQELRRSLRQVQAKMRSGYDAKTGARLKERLADLQARWRTERCR